MTKTMKAVGFKRYGMSDVLEQLELPIPEPTDDEVLIRVAAVAINPADWMFRNGQFRFFMAGKLPFIPGADVAGEVTQVGKNVTDLKPGDRVYAMLSTMKGGGYAEYVVAKASQVAVAPRTISLAEAAAVPLTALTALQALRDRANLKPGKHVLIHGASGGVGTFAVQIAKAMGAAHVTGVCSGTNADLVRSIGADKVIDYTQADLFQLDNRYDVIFAAIWNHPFWQWRRLLTPQGVVVSVNPIAQNPLNTLLARLRGQQRLRSVIVKPSKTDLDLIREWIEAGQIQPVIDREYPLAQAAEAQDYSESKRVAGKLILVVDEALAATSPEKLIASSPSPV